MIRRSVRRCLGFLAALFILWPGIVSSNQLLIKNETQQDILNILATAPARENYFRLDLQPDAQDRVENPGLRSDLRIDTGHELVRFSDVDLADAVSLTISMGPALLLRTRDGKTIELKGNTQHLIPRGEEAPVCHISSFHPSMPMKDVCDILSGELPRDDNGALLTGLGFAGMTWAARLSPRLTDPDTNPNDLLLEHMELRRPLDKKDISKLISYLLEQGYTPWQAELPGLDMEFSEQATTDTRKDLLLSTLDKFLLQIDHQSHKEKKCDQATIIFAPADQLQELQTADEPGKDIDIYTIILRPCTKTLIVDVAAYHGSGS